MDTMSQLSRSRIIVLSMASGSRMISSVSHRPATRWGTLPLSPPRVNSILYPPLGFQDRLLSPRRCARAGVLCAISPNTLNVNCACVSSLVIGASAASCTIGSPVNTRSKYPNAVSVYASTW